MGREEEIRLIAYSIWEQEGCCNGHDMEHWLRAEVLWEEKQKREIASTQTKKDARQGTVHTKKKKGSKNKS